MKGHAALVTGSSRGIGRSIALALARRGCSVALHGREQSQALSDAEEEVRGLGVQGVALTGDLSDDRTCGRLVEEAEAVLGPLTTLVSNAGVGALRRCDPIDTALDSFDHCMSLNARAPFLLLQAFSKRALSRPRSPGVTYTIIVVSSVSAVAASVNRIEYCMSKSAVAMMAKVFALRLAGEGIQVFDVQPGIIATDMSRAALPAYEQRIRDEGLVPMGRVGTPDEIGKLCAAAAAGDIPYTVGQVLRPDGGLMLERL